MILGQNWPKTAKSSCHCSFKAEKDKTKKEYVEISVTWDLILFYVLYVSLLYFSIAQNAIVFRDMYLNSSS